MSHSAAHRSFRRFDQGRVVASVLGVQLAARPRIENGCPVRGCTDYDWPR